LQNLAGVIGNAAGRLAGHERLVAGGSGTRFDFRVEPANPTPLLPPPPPAQPAPQVYVVQPPAPPAAPAPAPVNPGVVNVNLTFPPGWSPTPPAPPKAPAAAAGGKPPAKKPANPAKAAAGTATP